METTKTPKRPVPEITFGDYVRIARRELGLSQGDLAARLGVSHSRLAAWETGRNVPHDIRRITDALERATGISRHWFIWGIDPNGTGPDDLMITHRYSQSQRQRRYVRAAEHIAWHRPFLNAADPQAA